MGASLPQMVILDKSVLPICLGFSFTNVIYDVVVANLHHEHSNVHVFHPVH